MIKPAGHGAERGRRNRRAVRPGLHRDISPRRVGAGWSRWPRASSATMALGWAAVWKNCSSFATVFRSSVPSTVFHAPLCFPKQPPLTLYRSTKPLPFPRRPCPSKASHRYTANFSLLSLFRRRTKRQRRLNRSPEKASFSFLPECTE